MQPEIRRILVPLDFTPSSDRALAYARLLSTRLGASLHLLHVIDDRLSTGPWPSEVYLGELPSVRDDLVHEAERRLLDCLQSLAVDGMTATGNVLMGGPSHVIAEQAEVANADVIVMGTHSRTGIAHLLIGSVTERVIRHAPCPVLVVGDRKVAKSSLASAAVGS